MGTTDNASANQAVKNLQDQSTNTVTGSPLSGSVGFGGDNHPDDVLTVSSALAANDRIDQLTSEAGDVIGSKIITAQQDMGGLKVDGLIKPGGPTEQRFTHFVSGGMMNKPNIPTSRPDTGISGARPNTGDAATNASLTAERKASAVEDARNQAWANASDPNRTSFQQAQDVKRLEKAKQDASNAKVRAQQLDAKRREREQRQQIEATQRINKQAAQQSNEANPKVAQGVAKLATKAASFLSEHLTPEKNIERTALPELSNEAWQENNRAARYLGDQAIIGDYPRWVIDAIENQQTVAPDSPQGTAIAEGGDLIQQIAERNPERAQDFYQMTVKGLSHHNRVHLDHALGIWSMPKPSPDDDTSPRVLPLPIPDASTTPPTRTMEYNPERDGHARLMLLDETGVADGGAQAGPLLTDAGISSKDSTPAMLSPDRNAEGSSERDDLVEDIESEPFQPMAEGGAAHVQPGDTPVPKGHADQIEGAGVGTDEQDLRIESGLKSLDAVNASLADGKTMNREDMRLHRERMGDAFRYDEDAKNRANALMDAAESGNLDDIAILQRDLNALANDPARRKAQQQSAAYYRNTTQADRLANADVRGKIRDHMELKVQNALVNQAGIAEQNGLIAKHATASQAGDPNAKQIVDRARARRDELIAANDVLTDKIAKDAAGYQSIQAHPHPDIDKRGGREQEASENRNRKRQELATDAALLAGTGGAAALGRKGAARAISGAALNTANAASTYSRELSRVTARAMAKDGVDFTSKRAAANWVRVNPDLSRKLSNQALQAAGLQFAAGKVGEKAGDAVENPLGGAVVDFGASELANEVGELFKTSE